MNSYLDSQKEPITLWVQFGTLNDGPTYASNAILEAQSKNLNVTIGNFGYQKMSK